MSELHMFRFKKPIAVPPVDCWTYDLPGPNDPPTIAPYPPVMSGAPNYLDDIFLELPRQEIMDRESCAYLTLLSGLMLPLFLALPIIAAIVGKGIPPLILSIGCLTSFFLCSWVTIYYWRLSTEPPLDNPIRFNRARRKVYIYRFHHSGRHLFSNIGWGVKPVAYDWDDLHAELSSAHGARGAGCTMQKVTLAVLEPETHRVVERFVLAYRGQEAEMYWALAQIFMQQGPQALPHFDKPPRDWNNEEHFLNIARRFAPKVKWPEDMDLESRTAP
jgi:hypothetical protein